MCKIVSDNSNYLSLVEDESKKTKQRKLKMFLIKDWI